jgi:hypothetical protein
MIASHSIVVFLQHEIFSAAFKARDEAGIRQGALKPSKAFDKALGLT